MQWGRALGGLRSTGGEGCGQDPYRIGQAYMPVTNDSCPAD